MSPEQLSTAIVGALTDQALRDEDVVYRRPTSIALAPFTNTRGARGLLVEFSW